MRTLMQMTWIGRQHSATPGSTGLVKAHVKNLIDLSQLGRSPGQSSDKPRSASTWMLEVCAPWIVSPWLARARDQIQAAGLACKSMDMSLHGEAWRPKKLNARLPHIATYTPVSCKQFSPPSL